MTKIMYAVKEQTTCDIVGIYNDVELAVEKIKELNKIHDADDSVRDHFGDSYSGYYDTMPRYYVSEIEVQI